MQGRPFTVALTGGIASGKSAVADRFERLGARVIDADIIARELVASESPALAEIIDAFGAEVADAAGMLDRRRLRERVFASESDRRRLESILHPRVRDELRRRSARIDAPYALLVVPLLVETGEYDWVDRVLVVDVPRDVQLERLMSRDGIDAGLANAMLDAQASRAQRLQRADDVLENNWTARELETRVDSPHTRYLRLAHARATQI
jgi:dephospho-CoA kinase